MPAWKVYRDDGTVNEVTEPEAWSWAVTYTDGSTLKQFGDDGVFHWFKEIDQDRLYTFSMIHETLPPVTIFWRAGMKLIHFYRNFVIKSDVEQSHTRVTCYGYQEGAIKVIFVVLPDNRVFIVEDIDKLEI